MKTHIKTDDEFATFAARRILSLIERAIDQQDHCTIALSGGATPLEVYRSLVELQKEFEINWRRVFFFWGDERMVPAHDASNNAFMASTTLLDLLPVPLHNIFAIRTDMEDEHSAIDYEEKLRNHFEVLSLRSFDIALLGLGADGHTLSLFPHSYAVKIKDLWTFGYKVNDQTGHRVTLLPTLINHSHTVIFLVKGAAKAQAVSKVMHSRYDPDQYPAQLIKPVNGRLEWILDETAATLIQSRVS